MLYIGKMPKRVLEQAYKGPISSNKWRLLEQTSPSIKHPSDPIHEYHGILFNLTVMQTHHLSAGSADTWALGLKPPAHAHCRIVRNALHNRPSPPQGKGWVQNPYFRLGVRWPAYAYPASIIEPNHIGYMIRGYIVGGCASQAAFTGYFASLMPLLSSSSTTLNAPARSAQQGVLRSSSP